LHCLKNSAKALATQVSIEGEFGGAVWGVGLVVNSRSALRMTVTELPPPRLWAAEANH
jgi:hypothetical protein